MSLLDAAMAKAAASARTATTLEALAASEFSRIPHDRAESQRIVFSAVEEITNDLYGDHADPTEDALRSLAEAAIDDRCAMWLDDPQQACRLVDAYRFAEEVPGDVRAASHRQAFVRAMFQEGSARQAFLVLRRMIVDQYLQWYEQDYPESEPIDAEADAREWAQDHRADMDQEVAP